MNLKSLTNAGMWAGVGGAIATVLVTLLSPEQGAAVADHAAKVGDYATTTSLIAAGFATACGIVVATLKRKQPPTV